MLTVDGLVKTFSGDAEAPPSPRPSRRRRHPRTRARRRVLRRTARRAVHAARPVGLREDHDAAVHRRASNGPTAGRSASTARLLFDSATGVAVPANARHLGMVFQSYAIWPHMTVFKNVAFPLEVLPRRSRPGTRRGRGARTEGARRGGAGRLRRPRGDQAVRRAAAAARAGPRAGHRAAPDAARRAAVQPGRQAARVDAVRAQADAARPGPDRDLRHARPGRGARAVEPHRGHERGPHRPDRQAARGVRASELPVRRGLHRRHQLPDRHRGGAVGGALPGADERRRPAGDLRTWTCRSAARSPCPYGPSA